MWIALKTIKQFTPIQKIFLDPLELTSFENVKVVILGQDPYHGQNQAHGLVFSVQENVPNFPPSLKNFFKEISKDLEIEKRLSGDLTNWANQGYFY
ncbi:MAG: hypothetical protein Ct9H90mP6_10590 [Gammaproteobacteria bacterium]|nr:MAG: hypothetical protein Ct9H90mP6_10590 [Gammaproteobacteria bacterium]